MRSRLLLVAELGPDGGTRLSRVEAVGALAARVTGPGRVHLVGTAAGPLNGDELEVEIEVGPGATLAVHSVVAMLALPGRGTGASRLRQRCRVGDGGRLELATEPLVVCSGAEVAVVTELELAGTARAELREQVVLGRHGEAGGQWSGRWVADRCGGDGEDVEGGHGGGARRPLLRTTTGAAALRASDGARVLLTTALLDAAQRAPGALGAQTRGQAVASPLAAGGLLVTALGKSLTTAREDHDAALAAVTAGTPPRK